MEAIKSQRNHDNSSIYCPHIYKLNKDHQRMVVDQMFKSGGGEGGVGSGSGNCGDGGGGGGVGMVAVVVTAFLKGLQMIC